MFEEVKNVLNLTLDLFRGAENVSIVLLESTNSDQTAQGARNFVSVKDTKVGPTNGEVTVAANTMLEHNAMGGTVHGLETMALLIVLKDEHVLLVVLVMTRRLPKLEVENVR